MLAEIMEDYKVVNSVGNHIGKIKDIYLDLNTWNITGFEISPGPLKKDFIISQKNVIKFDDADKIVIVEDGFEKIDKPDNPVKQQYPFEELKKHHVVDRHGEKVGKIYNLEIPFEKLKTFKVWKVLIKTGIKDRRLRLPPSEITEVMDVIHLRGTEEEYSEKME